MLEKQKNRMNLKILGMLREKGAPTLTPFPGEQGFESTDLDLDQMGDVLVAGSKPEELPNKKKKKKLAAEEEE